MSNATIIPAESKFSTLLNVELQNVDQAAAMVDIFNDAYVANDGFDFSKALQIAKDHTEMAVIGTKTSHEKKQTQQVWASIEQLQNLMQMVEGAATQDWAMFGLASRAFLDLNAQKNGGYFNIFSQSSKNISYRYNMFQVMQNKQTGAVMSGQLTSVDINLESEDANVLALVAGSSTTLEINFKSLIVVEAL